MQKCMFFIAENKDCLIKTDLLLLTGNLVLLVFLINYFVDI